MDPTNAHHLSTIPDYIPWFNRIRRYHRHEVLGLANIPKSGGALVVPNHSFATYDVLMIGGVVFEATGRPIRGLADRLAFRVPGVRTLLRDIGMVEASQENARALLAHGEILGIPPGGMREAIRGHRDRYKINWAGRKGIARLAIDTQSPIVLAACPGADDIYTVHSGKLSELVYKQLKIPFVLPVGLFGTLLPKPVTVTHHLSEPVRPPPRVASGAPGYSELVDAFHAELVARMEAHMAEALRSEGRVNGRK